MLFFPNAFRQMSKPEDETDKREFDNTFPDYEENSVLLDSSCERLADPLAAEINKNVDKLLEKLERGLREFPDKHDYSLYTGTAGVALLYYHLYKRRGDYQYLQEGVKWIEDGLKRLKGTGRRKSYLCGDAGSLAVGAVIHHATNDHGKTEDCIHRLQAMMTDVCSDADAPDEILYGRAGYLLALLFVRKHVGADSVDDGCVRKVYKAIVESGKSLAKDMHSKSPLMYQWHDKQYLGAAHGISGVLYVLMQADDTSQDMDALVKPTLEYLHTLHFPSGNFPSSLGSRGGDMLVHWCHGAPGFLFMFARAYTVFKDDRYLQAAVDCGEVIWQRGLLRKGYGICHGVAGNAYALLALYRLTSDEKHLYRACKFAEWCCDYGKHGCRMPDHPYSLFEGLAGTIYFLSDVLEPKKALFPAFEL